VVRMLAADRDITLEEARKELLKLESEATLLEIELKAKTEKFNHLKSEIKSYRLALGL
jgi:hypothetical protein